MSCYCYIVECSDGTFYTGWTTDPDRRVKEHNAGRGARYTSMRTPVRLVYLETHPNRSTAQKREYKLKNLSHDRKRELAESYP